LPGKNFFPRVTFEAVWKVLPGRTKNIATLCATAAGRLASASAEAQSRLLFFATPPIDFAGKAAGHPQKIKISFRG